MTTETGLAVTTPARAGWIDIAKAISIILVVLHHSVGRFDDLPDFVVTLNNSLISLRMPLFFFASGLFMASALKMDIRSLWAKRLVQLLYIYVLWSAIKLVVIGSADAFITNDPVDWNLFKIFIDPPATLWFVYALALFTLLLWTLRAIKPWIIVLGALAVYLTFFGDGQLYGLSFGMRLPRMFLWFACGYAFSGLARLWVPRVPTWAAGGVVIWLAAAVAIMSGETTEWWIMLPFSVTAILCSLILAVALERTRLCSALAYVGRNTLPIYVMHFLIVYPASLLGNIGPNLSAVCVVIVWTAGVALPLIAKKIADRLGQKWPFEAPRVLRHIPYLRRREAMS